MGSERLRDLAIVTQHKVAVSRTPRALCRSKSRPMSSLKRVTLSPADHENADDAHPVACESGSEIRQSTDIWLDRLEKPTSPYCPEGVVEGMAGGGCGASLSSH